MAASTANEIEAVAATSKRLQTALQHARSVKDVTTVDPPLPLSSLESDIDHVLDDINEMYDQNYRFAAIETAARDIFYTLITSSAIGEPAFVEVWNLLDILLVGGDRGKCAPELVVWLIEELLDSQTTDGCRMVFDYLESRRERLAQKDFHKKNLVFLRSCNELLRRLSRAEDASFCGRVFFFLFQTFPLGDKSSVNLRGEFHVENTTVFDESTSAPEIHTEESAVGTADAISTPMSQSATKADPKSNSAKSVKRQREEENVDNSILYPVFWRLQQSFSEPTRLFKPAEFQSFKAALALTISRFKKVSTVTQTSASTERGNKLKCRADDDGADVAENYNPKYLTSRDLFDLELSDRAFQRHILVQGLILLNFLLSLTEKAKQKLLATEHPNKSLLYDFTLNADDTRWAIETSTSIVKHFKDNPEGHFYDRMVYTILTRDRNWVRWKIESCPSIVRDAVSIDDVPDVRSKIQHSMKPRRVDARAMGSMELDFLNNDHNGGLNALRESGRYTAPELNKLLDVIRTDGLDLDMATDDDEKSSLENLMQNKTWRLFRDARTSNVAILGRYDAAKTLEDVFRPKSSNDVELVDVAA